MNYKEFFQEYRRLVRLLLNEPPKINEWGIMVSETAESLSDLCDSVPEDWEDRADAEL